MPAAAVAVDVEGGVGREEPRSMSSVVRRDGGEVVVDDPRRCGAARREAVEPPGVEPEHLGLDRGGAGGDGGPEGVDRPGERGVVVRVVAAPHDAVRADEGHQRGQGVLVDLEADGALAGEVLRRGAARGRGRSRRRTPPARRGARARTGAQPPEDSKKTTRRPGWRSSTPKAMSCAQASISSKECDTACRISGLNGRSEPERRHDDRAALVDADRHVELLGRVPQRVVGAVGQRAAEAGVGTDEAGDEAELGDRPPQLARRRRRVLQRQHGRAEEPGADRRRSSSASQSL